MTQNDFCEVLLRRKIKTQNVYETPHILFKKIANHFCDGREQIKCIKGYMQDCSHELPPLERKLLWREEGEGRSYPKIGGIKKTSFKNICVGVVVHVYASKMCMFRLMYQNKEKFLKDCSI